MKSVSDNIRSLLVLTFYESNISKIKKEFLISSYNIRSLPVLTFYESNLSKMKKEFLISSYNLFKTTKFVCVETGIHNT